MSAAVSQGNATGQGEADFDTARLASWLETSAPDIGSVEAIAKFPGGQSNPTYRLTSGDRSYVLRRKPFGDILPSAHAVDREYRLLSALWPTGFPVAQPIALCEDPAVIGSTFYLMAMVEGRVFWDGALPDLSAPARSETYQAMIETLARLHSIDPGDVGMADYGAPGNYFERQVRRWTRQYRASQTEDIPEVERLIDWLPRTLPAQDRVSIIHGDYRIDNLIYAAERPEVSAVLDWELSTLGDPLADFAYLAMNWALPAEHRRAQIGGLDLSALGIPTLQEATDLYCSRTGRAGIPQLEWYFAYNLFRLVGILQGIRKRFLDGNASSAQAEQSSARVRPLALQAWEFARRAGAPQHSS